MPSNFRNRSVNQNRFAMVPRSDVPRSKFLVEFTHKTTFDAGYLVPVYVEEILPGDTFQVSMTGFARLATPLFPLMDNLHLDSFFFFVPNRLVWPNWVKMMGEQDDPDDSIDYMVPQMEFADVPAVCSLYDYMGIPTTNQVTGTDFSVNALPIRAYKLIYNQWFRDQNLQDSLVVWDSPDGPDDGGGGSFAPLRRGKRHDYFTSALPWPLKGGEEVALPLGTRAPVKGFGRTTDAAGDGAAIPVWETPGAGLSGFSGFANASSNPAHWRFALEQNAETSDWEPALYADLSEATAATINALRMAFAVQSLLEKDARGGTRYTEQLLSHFGVQPQDQRLQRPEYLGGGSTPVNINPIAQTSATGIDGGASPLGALGAVGTSVARHGFSSSFSEHGFVIGIVNIRSDLTYQQGLHRMWTRRTREEYYFPVFANLGEQAVLRSEIYFTGEPESDNVVFGYQERFAEYRYHPSQISGLFRSAVAGNIDEWHLAQEFSSAPTLNSTFIVENPPMARVLAAGSLAANQQFLFDSLFSIRMTRAMPVHSVPGLGARF